MGDAAISIYKKKKLARVILGLPLVLILGYVIESMYILRDKIAT